jgi:Fur family transcriptional regulator, zinc uptake regulator
MSHDLTRNDLTRNQQLVYDAMQHANEPLSAYTLLDKLRGDGLKAPLQIYRALDKLVEHGLVHRLETLNAFVACQHTHAHEDAPTVFMICKTCGTVAECSNTCLDGDLKQLALGNGFRVEKTSIELRGKCAKC